AGNTATNSWAGQMAAAELMITAGTNVVMAVDTAGWDTHGDNDGAKVRNMMGTHIMPALKTFMTRMMNAPGKNVVIMMMGDFSRTNPGSNHQPNMSAIVWGK